MDKTETREWSGCLGHEAAFRGHRMEGLYLHSTLPSSEQVLHLHFDVLDTFLVLFLNGLALLVSAVIVLKHP